jgi:hypothetical protein
MSCAGGRQWVRCGLAGPISVACGACDTCRPAAASQERATPPQVFRMSGTRHIDGTHKRAALRRDVESGVRAQVGRAPAGGSRTERRRRGIAINANRWLRPPLPAVVLSGWAAVRTESGLPGQ